MYFKILHEPGNKAGNVGDKVWFCLIMRNIICEAAQKVEF
jgi:hypothetical protein